MPSKQAVCEDIAASLYAGLFEQVWSENGELALDVGGKPIRVLIELRKAVSRHRLLMNPIKSALIACARSR